MSTNTLDKNTLRQLRIKTGIVHRITKDISSYKKEADIQQQRLDRMKEEGKDEYDIMKMGFVLQETLGMVPHCIKRLIAANEELENILKGIQIEDGSYNMNEKEIEQIKVSRERLTHAANKIKEEESHDDKKAKDKNL